MPNNDRRQLSEQSRAMLRAIAARVAQERRQIRPGTRAYHYAQRVQMGRSRRPG